MPLRASWSYSVSTWSVVPRSAWISPNWALVAHHRRGDECGRTGKEAERARVAGVGDQDGSLAPQHLRLVQSRTERRRIRRAPPRAPPAPSARRRRANVLSRVSSRPRTLNTAARSKPRFSHSACAASRKSAVQRAERPQAPQRAAHSGVGKRVHGASAPRRSRAHPGRRPGSRPSRFSLGELLDLGHDTRVRAGGQPGPAMSDSESPSFTTKVGRSARLTGARKRTRRSGSCKRGGWSHRRNGRRERERDRGRGPGGGAGRSRGCRGELGGHLHAIRVSPPGGRGHVSCRATGRGVREESRPRGRAVGAMGGGPRGKERSRHRT